ncbi:hypothetical protein EVAR_56505_1 [Eumeta japonica]|uniref:Uncharacterized protein n=1 Tax=Eumeta variegata TaxID=151549 RepID=A0A4C1XLK7_EUMVA|nr:hypothetical protein EVAR_56505_1 [Eumeta japonica]
MFPNFARNAQAHVCVYVYVRLSVFTQFFPSCLAVDLVLPTRHRPGAVWEPLTTFVLDVMTSSETGGLKRSRSIISTVKQERPMIRGAGPHPALRERGRAIPPASGVPTPPSRGPVPLPPHARVRSPLYVYYEVEVQVRSRRCQGKRQALAIKGVARPDVVLGFRLEKRGLS